MRWKIGAIGVSLLLTLTVVAVGAQSNLGSVAEPMAIQSDKTASSASGIEDITTEIHPALTYQEDAHIPGDAPNECENLDRRRTIDAEGEQLHAMLVQMDDESDVFLSETGDFSGDRLAIQFDIDLAPEFQSIGFQVLTADCGINVLDPNAPIYDSISPLPGAGEKLVYADLDARCSANRDEWRFHVSDDKPASIFIEWTNGEWETQSFVDGNNGAGNYITAANPGYDIRSAEIIVADDWDGNFDLMKKPCNTVDGGAAPVERQVPAPSGEGLYAEWEARADEYVILVYITSSISGTALESVPTEKITQTMRCHFDFCAPAFSKVEYRGTMFEA